MMVALTVVIPAHDSGGRLRDALRTLAQELEGTDLEVVIVENGSRDDTWQEARRLAAEGFPFPVVACQSATGIGAAYHEGALRATGRMVLLTADDLPFGVSDIQAWQDVGAPDGMTLGSKAHPASLVPRGLARELMSGGFRLLRWLILGMRVKDCQGTVLVERDWLVGQVPGLCEQGYLASTEIVQAALRDGVVVREVPVKLAEHDEDSRTRIRPRDVIDMGLGLFRIRRADRLRRRASV
ncbi:MAG: glycosyltransferase [Propionibacteriaceae bacterium]|nr:glycosyltransferase [Propionibacteriaceae bacterium]